VDEREGTLERKEDRKMMVRWSLVVAVVLAGLAAALGCGKKPEPVTEIKPPETTVAAPDTAAQRRAAFDDLFRRRQAEEAAKAAQAAQAAQAAVLVMDDVHFEYDKYTLTPEARQILNETARRLKEKPDLVIQIEGHCDERGTQEYNLALGQRRAQAAKDYLANFGIDPGRITIISYGEERPLDPASNEDAWSRNRRAHFNRR
jgi:peptidoglycan-associated lipoprotein